MLNAKSLPSGFAVLIGIFLLFSTHVQAQKIGVGKSFTVQTTPQTTVLYEYVGMLSSKEQILNSISAVPIETQVDFKRLGAGSVQLSANKSYPRTLVGIAEGFIPEVVSFEYNKDLKKRDIVFNLTMLTRVFQLDAQPFDAEIWVDGALIPRPYPVDITLYHNESKTVEVRRKGFQTIKQVYYNIEGKPTPPTEFESISLENRTVQLSTDPIKGSRISVNGKEIGEGNAKIAIPFNSCVIVTIRNEGFIEQEIQYCYKENMPEPPLSDLVRLKDRRIVIRGPEGSSISINGKKVGTGEYALKLQEGSFARVMVEKSGFIPYVTTLYNTETDAATPAFLTIEEGTAVFPKDESFKSSSETDMANRDFVLQVPTTMDDLNAWQLISSVVQTHFDILEQIDRETGYLRTAWTYKRYVNRTVRTRAILKMNNRDPLSYRLKIQSQECSEPGKLDSRDDDDYSDWTRVLNVYNTVISEAQSRLK